MKKGFDPKKFLKLKGLFSLPTKPDDFFPWLVKRLFLYMGGGSLLGWFIILIVAGSFMAFLIGDFGGNGSGTVDANGTVSLDAATQAQNHALKVHYDDVASQWENGLSQDQIQQVQQEQADVPGAVLMSLDKMVSNFESDNAQAFYDGLKPTFKWKTYTIKTITYENVTTKQYVAGQYVDKTECKATETDTTVQMLESATTWDGTVSNTYKIEETGSKGCSSSGKSVWTSRPVLVSSNKAYSWDRVWALLAKYPTTDGTILKNTQENQDILAGLIATQDYSISDPNVQQMVQTILFQDAGSFNLPTDFKVGPADKDTVKNVLRWKDYITAVATKYHVPATLVAAQMAQESGGDQYDPTGAVLQSSAGALGLMQVEPYTAAGMYLDGKPIGDSAIALLSNPLINMEIGTEYISELYHEFGQNIPEELSAYNAGPGAEETALHNGHTIAQNSQTIEYVAIITQKWIPAFEPALGQINLAKN